MSTLISGGAPTTPIGSYALAYTGAGPGVSDATEIRPRAARRARLAAVPVRPPQARLRLLLEVELLVLRTPVVMSICFIFRIIID